MTILQQYFGLQLKLLKRQLIDFGLHPIAALIIIVTGFVVLSFYIFTKTAYANYFYMLMALSIVIRYSESNRNDFLKFTFAKIDYYKIRFAENFLTVLPFILFLSFKKQWYASLILLAATIAILFLSPSKKGSLTIPTPFYKKPFEFIVGFRNSFIAFLFAYFLTVMSIIYQNFNLGIFSLVLVFLICLSFYTQPETEFYVWVHKLKVNAFLFDKIITAIFFSTIISLPIVIALLFSFSHNSLVILGFLLLGYLYLSTIILAKYAAYPNTINLPQGILFTFGIAMPPLLLLTIPFFYTQSTKQLKEILA